VFEEADEEETGPKKIKFSEEYRPQSVIHLSDLNNWVHDIPNILDSGRIVHSEPVKPESLDEDKWDQELEMKKQISKDR